MQVLLDSGGGVILAHKQILPQHCTPFLYKNARTSNTIAGKSTSKQSICLQDIALPEFDCTKQIDSQGAFMFGSKCYYNLILA